MRFMESVLILTPCYNLTVIPLELTFFFAQPRLESEVRQPESRQARRRYDLQVLFVPQEQRGPGPVQRSSRRHLGGQLSCRKQRCRLDLTAPGILEGNRLCRGIR